MARVHDFSRNAVTKKTDKKCRVCKGAIVKKVVSVLTRLSGFDTFGPGSGVCFRQVVEGYYCSKCGVRYEFIPGRYKNENKI